MHLQDKERERTEKRRMRSGEGCIHDAVRQRVEPERREGGDVDDVRVGEEGEETENQERMHHNGIACTGQRQETSSSSSIIINPLPAFIPQ
jgi:hypothetical protein